MKLDRLFSSDNFVGFFNKNIDKYYAGDEETNPHIRIVKVKKT